jgi:hypothetical protein
MAKESKQAVADREKAEALAKEDRSTSFSVTVTAPFTVHGLLVAYQQLILGGAHVDAKVSLNAGYGRDQTLHPRYRVTASWARDPEDERTRP